MMEDEFIQCCIEGNLDRAKELWEQVEIDLEESGAFYWCLYESDNLEMVEWLWSIGNFKDVPFEYAFRTCVLEGKNDMARWLIEISDGVLKLEDYQGREIVGGYQPIPGTGNPPPFDSPVQKVVVDL